MRLNHKIEQTRADAQREDGVLLQRDVVGAVGRGVGVGECAFGAEGAEVGFEGFGVPFMQLGSNIS